MWHSEILFSLLLLLLAKKDNARGNGDDGAFPVIDEIDSHWDFGDDGDNPKPSPAITASPTASLDPNYRGCWIDPTFNVMEFYGGNEYGISTCIAYCKIRDFSFAGLQYGDHCFCGNSYSSSGQTREDDCHLKCSVGKGNCGGFGFLSVWSVGINPTPQPLPGPTPRSTYQPSTPEPTELPTTDPTHMPTPEPTAGRLPTSRHTSMPTHYPTPQPTLTPTLLPTLLPTPLPTTFPTPEPSPSPTPMPTPYPSSNPTGSGIEYIGCYVDAPPIRAMQYSAGNGFGINNCIAHCDLNNFPFAAVQFFDQCTCGNGYNRHGSAPENECNTKCKYGSGVCGGAWRMSVWTTGKPIPPTVAPTRGPATSFNIDLDLQGVQEKFDFQNAVDTWGRVIKGDLRDVAEYLPGESACGNWPTFVDDLYICGRYLSIDGPGGILGSAGPRYYRNSGTPITGEMRFDAEDVGQEWLNLLGVIMHEMGHVLGIGPLWKTNGLTPSRNVPCPYALDSEATREFHAISGCWGAIPVEQSFPGSGSNCGHWQEMCFQKELMTPAAGKELPMSRITIAGLADLGYVIDYAEAATFDVHDINPNCVCDPELLQGPGRELSDSTTTSGSDDRRQLSDEGRAVAISYGKMILFQNREDTLHLSPPPAWIKDLGQEVIYVLYIEEQTIHSVMVTLDDL